MRRVASKSKTGDNWVDEGLLALSMYARSRAVSEAPRCKYPTTSRIAVRVKQQSCHTGGLRITALTKVRERLHCLIYTCVTVIGSKKASPHEKELKIRWSAHLSHRSFLVIAMEVVEL